jgi:hypothetical protein
MTANNVACAVDAEQPYLTFRRSSYLLASIATIETPQASLKYMSGGATMESVVVHDAAHTGVSPEPENPVGQSKHSTTCCPNPKSFAIDSDLERKDENHVVINTDHNESDIASARLWPRGKKIIISLGAFASYFVRSNICMTLP